MSPKPKMKLIRDLIPEDMHKRGYQPALVILSPSGRLEWLLEKLVEEAAETKSDGGSLEECADVYETLRSVVEARGMKMEDIIARADAKAAVSRKGFSGQTRTTTRPRRRSRGSHTSRSVKADGRRISDDLRL